MTDLPIGPLPVPPRLGTAARIEEGELVLELTPSSHVLAHGMVRASVLAYLIDVAAGVPLDLLSDDWTFTTDLSVRAPAQPAPAAIIATNRLLRNGRRSATSATELTTDDGTPFGSGAIGFAHTARRPDDPPKHEVSLDYLVEVFAPESTLTRPLRDEAGIRSIDRDEGVVEIDIVTEVCNPAGTLQGAMVALVAEAAAEDLVAARTGVDVFVTDLDLRYLARTGAGPVRTSSRLLVDGPNAAVEVELVDVSTGVTTTHVYARTTPVP